jgi:ubiquitin-protein ligase
MSTTGPSPALKRLQRDWLEIQQNPLDLVCAAPVSELNMFEWHANVMGAPSSKYSGNIFHLKINYPQNYPQNAPRVHLYTTVHRSHVYGSWICLDMLETHYTNQLYTGWSTAYTTLSILLQLQSYLFDEDEKYFRPQPGMVRQCILDARKFKCPGCTHNMKTNAPWPVTPAMTKRDTTPVRKLNSTLNHARMEKKKEERKKKEIEEWATVKKQLRKNIRDSDFASFTKGGRTMHAVVALEYEDEERKESVPEPIQEQVAEEPIKEKKPRKLKFSELSQDVISHSIFAFLNEIDLQKCQKVSLLWKRYAEESARRRDFGQTTTCFHTKKSCKETVLGVGVNLRKNPYSGALQYADSPLDTISWSAFSQENIRKGVWREPFTHFLPLFINKTHAAQSWKYFTRNVCEMMDKKEFNPIDAVQLLCMLMNTQVVSVMNGNLHCSIKGLNGYSWFHRWLIALTEKYPSVQEYADKRVHQFIHNSKARSKESVPIMGDFLPLLSISKYTWADVSDVLLEEVFARNVTWCFKKYPHLRYEVAKQSRIAASFDSSRTMNGLLMFHVHFLKTIARPKGLTLQQVAAEYDARNGAASVLVQDKFQNDVFYLQGVDNFEEFFECVDIATDMDIHDMLLQSIKNSLNFGYHYPLKYIQTISELKEQQRKFTGKKNDDWSPWTKKFESEVVPITMVVDDNDNLIKVRLPFNKKRNN